MFGVYVLQNISGWALCPFAFKKVYFGLLSCIVCRVSFVSSYWLSGAEIFGAWRGEGRVLRWMAAAVNSDPSKLYLCVCMRVNLCLIHRFLCHLGLYKLEFKVENNGNEMGLYQFQVNMPIRGGRLSIWVHL